MADDQPTVTQTVAVPQASPVPERLALALGVEYEVRARVGSGSGRGDGAQTSADNHGGSGQRSSKGG